MNMRLPRPPHSSRYRERRVREDNSSPLTKAITIIIIVACIIFAAKHGWFNNIDTTNRSLSEGYYEYLDSYGYVQNLYYYDKIDDRIYKWNNREQAWRLTDTSKSHLKSSCNYLGTVYDNSINYGSIFDTYY